MPSAIINTTATAIVVAAPAKANGFIRVHSYSMVASGTVNTKFQSNTTDLTGPMNMSAGVPNEITFSDGLFDTNPGDPLKINLDQAIQVSGVLDYSVH